MKILFLIYHGFSNTSGISKKIKYQINGLKECGHEVYICTYTILENQHRVRMINNNIIQDYGKGRIAAIKKRLCYNSIYNYVKSNNIDFIYVRSFHNANPFTVKLFSKIKALNIKMVMEIPTFPYDHEYINYSIRNRMGLIIDKIFRNKLASYFDYLVTFTDDKNIFNKRTINISNGIDFNAISLQNKQKNNDNTINLTGVAEVHYWHGFDRIIEGLGKYYQKPHKYVVILNIIGGIANSEMYGFKGIIGFKELIKKYNISKYVIFHGPLYGKNLEDVLNITDFAVGSLARHRCGIKSIKTLKNREYAARGIPFIYSENDSDFDDKPYIIKARPDESPIDINSIINFIKENRYNPIDIRNSIQNLSWKEQMNKVIKQVYYD